MGLLLPLLPGGSRRKRDAAGEVTLRCANALLKRQATPSRRGGEMSHNVVERRPRAIERKGLGRGKRSRTEQEVFWDRDSDNYHQDKRVERRGLRSIGAPPWC